MLHWLALVAERIRKAEETTFKDRKTRPGAVAAVRRTPAGIVVRCLKMRAPKLNDLQKVSLSTVSLGLT